MQNLLKINNDFSFMIVISDLILAGIGSEYVLVIRRKLVDIIRTSEGFRLGVKSEFLRAYIREITEFSQLTGKGKGIPITGHECPWRKWMQGSTYSQPRH